jgi:hypothetical protein
VKSPCGAKQMYLCPVEKNRNSLDLLDTTQPFWYWIDLGKASSIG